MSTQKYSLKNHVIIHLALMVLGGVMVAAMTERLAGSSGIVGIFNLAIAIVFGIPIVIVFWLSVILDYFLIVAYGLYCLYVVLKLIINIVKKRVDLTKMHVVQLLIILVAEFVTIVSLIQIVGETTNWWYM